MTKSNDPERGDGGGGGGSSSRRKVRLLPLVFLTFYEVSGGPFGIEDSVRAAGPLLAILGFLVFPFLWSIPEALITAEMGTMFPENGGYVVWVASCLGPYWGFQEGWLKWLTGSVDAALYPVLFLDYLVSAVPALSGGLLRASAVMTITVVLTYLNYRGMTVVGGVAVFLGVFSILPFVIMGLVAIPKIKPARWLARPNSSGLDVYLYLNTLFWNLNSWDSISTLVGEVRDPARTLPKALTWTLVLVVLTYVWPLLAGTGAAARLDRKAWTDGHFSDVAGSLGGAWLQTWIQAAAALSNAGMFVAAVSSNSYQLLGMAERGMIPELFGRRSRYGTPVPGILISAAGVLVLSWFSFQEIVAIENFVYCVAMLLEFVAFVRLRMVWKEVSRPYKVPMGTFGCCVMLVPPTLLLVTVLALASLKVVVAGLGAVVVGLVLVPCLKQVEKRRWFRFSVNPDLPKYTEGGEDGDNSMSLLS